MSARLEDLFEVAEAERAHHCHRLLVAEYLKRKWGDVEIVHL